LLNYTENEPSAFFTGLEFEKINKCIGNPEADKENPGCSSKINHITSLCIDIYLCIFH